MRKIVIFILLISSLSITAQELNCTVTVNSDRIRGSNRTIFVTLQNTISEYLNATKWTNRTVKPFEKIKCAVSIFILDQPQPNQFKGNIQIQVNRPVYKANYQTTIFNFKDDNLSFSYKEFDPFFYNENSFDNNLVSILTFYAYTILGIDADSFAPNGGEVFYEQAENVVNQAQQSGYVGWGKIDGNGTRYELNENILSPVYSEFRKAVYQYHREGLDIMSTNAEVAKKAIANAIIRLQKIYDARPNAFLLRVFTDAKADEIVSIFSGGPTYDVAKLRSVLLKISPYNNSKWKKLNN
jgi:Domain of unknown function (DUF4835)